MNNMSDVCHFSSRLWIRRLVNLLELRVRSSILL